MLNEADAAILDAGHSYRNQAAHRDVHNPRGGRAIASLLLGAVGRLFATAGKGVMVGGFQSGEFDWLARYDLPTNRIEFNSAALKIVEVLERGLPVSIADVRRAMLGDLSERFDAIVAFPNEYLYGPSEADLAEMLSHEEFLAGFDDEAAGAEYREAIYTIAQGQNYPVDEFRRREERYQRSLRTARERLSPTLTIAGLRQLQEWLPRVQLAGSEVELLEAYVGADRRFAAYESALTSAALRLDSAIQFQIDLEQGK